MRVFEVGADGRLSSGACSRSAPPAASTASGSTRPAGSGPRTDDGVHCYDPDGTLIGKVRMPEVLSNVVFGGPRRNRLFITGATSLYAILLPVNGAKTF